VTSQVHSTQIPKKFKALTIDSKPSRGKWFAISISSDSSDASSYTIKSLPLKPDNGVRKITFGDMHLEVSINEYIKPSKEDLQMHGVISSKGSGQRRIASHKKYDF
jgi:hypothetical protein